MEQATGVAAMTASGAAFWAGVPRATHDPVRTRLGNPAHFDLIPALLTRSQHLAADFYCFGRALCETLPYRLEQEIELVGRQSKG